MLKYIRVSKRRGEDVWLTLIKRKVYEKINLKKLSCFYKYYHSGKICLFCVQNMMNL